MSNRAQIVTAFIAVLITVIGSVIVLWSISQNIKHLDERSYVINVPTEQTEALPLVIGLHGSGGNGLEFQSSSGLDSDKYITVYPNGIGFPTDWAGGECCGNALDTDDVSFIRELILDVENKYNVDKSRVFVVGFSSGGIMAYRLGCELSDLITGMGVHSGTIEVSDCSPTLPVSLIHIHGVEDRVVPIGGGDGLFDTVYFKPAHIGVEHYVKIDKCKDAKTIEIGNTNSQLWDACASDTAVSFITVKHQGHGWFVNDEFSSTKIMMEFLLKHPRA